MGKLAIVQAIVAGDPSVIGKPGPHGISLMTHATKGGKEAAEVVKLLRSLGKPSKAGDRKAEAKRANA